MKELSSVSDYVLSYFMCCDDLDKQQKKFANDALSKLYSVIHVNRSISYYLEKSYELDKVLNIFIRVNSGGTILSYSDLLLSFATAQWVQLDAREEINTFVDEINNIGARFKFSKDHVLKAALVLSDFQDISFKVDNFNRQNMQQIERNWTRISESIRIAVELISNFGFNRDNLSASLAIIPIAYFVYKQGVPKKVLTGSEYNDDREKMRKWLVSSLLRRVFSFTADGVLKPIREIIKQKSDTFPLDRIVDRFKGSNRDLTFSKDTIQNLLNIKYGQGDEFLILSIVYPWMDLSNKFSIDHIFPKSKFSRSYLRGLGMNEDRIKYYTENVNTLANLQLLDSIANISKNDKDFDDWLNTTYPTQNEKDSFCKKNYIPECSLDFLNFEEFISKRRKLLEQALYNASIH